MIKYIFIWFVLIIIFSSALYLWLIPMLSTQLSIVEWDFLAFIPTEIRIWFFLVILGLWIGTIKSFT